MNCPKCGRKLNQNICAFCGLKLKSSEIQFLRLLSSNEKNIISGFVRSHDSSDGLSRKKSEPTRETFLKDTTNQYESGSPKQYEEDDQKISEELISSAEKIMGGIELIKATIDLLDERTGYPNLDSKELERLNEEVLRCGDLYREHHEAFIKFREQTIQNNVKVHSAVRRQLNLDRVRQVESYVNELSSRYDSIRSKTHKLNSMKSRKNEAAMSDESVSIKRNVIQLEKRKHIYPNDPCPCGSGKKYKMCHGAPT